MTDELEPILIWTDGACSGNPGPGGWAFVKTFDGKAAGAHGGESPTTNNRMELMAVLKGLQSLPVKRDAHPVIVHADSTYVVKGVNDYLRGWIANGWKTSTKEPVKNQDLWEVIAGLIAGRAGLVTLTKVKAHTGAQDPNAFVDALAVKARDHAKGHPKEFSKKLVVGTLEGFPAPASSA
jgi:ribonuclease HI